MSLASKGAMGAVGLVFIAGIWLYAGQDVDATIQFLKGNWGPVLLGIQIVASSALMALDRYVAGAVLAGSALLTVAGMVA